MSSEYTLQILRVVVAQICQTIGWHSIQSTPLEILVDILHRYLQEITRATYHYTEFYGRIEPNLDDLALAFRDLGINIPDIEEYINYVDPVPCAVDVAKYPLHKESSLNFLKPGSKEVLTRPVHILEHLPPIFPEKEDEHVFEQNDVSESSIDVVNINSTSENIFKKPEISEMPIIKPKPRVLFEEEGRPAREITSVMMTSSGFISPAREGKLPDTKEPTIPEYSPIIQPSCSPPPLALSVSSIEKFDKKPKKKIPEKDKKRNSLKHVKMSKGGMMANSPSDGTKLFKKFKGKQKNKEHPDMHSMLPNKIFPIQSNDVSADNDILPPNQPKENFPLNSENSANLDEIKLSSEPDKQKLHIFKKLSSSSSKKERDDSTKSPNNISVPENMSTMPSSSIDPPTQPLKLEPIDTKPFAPLPVTDSNVIVVDDEAPSNKSPLSQMPMSFLPGPGLPTPLGHLKQHGHKRMRKRLAEQASPLNLSNEKIPRFGDNASFDRSYMTMIPEKVKEKKERKKPKNKESKKQQFQPMMPLQMPRFPIMKDPHPLFTPDKATLPTPDNVSKLDPGLKLPPSLISPSFSTIPALSLFNFYPFPPRPGLIPTTGMFPPLGDNPSLSKYLSMMRFPTPLNAADKGMRMSSFFEDEEPSPLPPAEIVCNVAPLVPDSMKLSLSPTRSVLPMKSKSSIISPAGPNQMGQKSPTIMPSRSSLGTTITPIISTSSAAPAAATSTPIPPQPPKSKFLEPPIEISDDEKRRSDSEEKETEPKQIPSMSGSFTSNTGISFSANKPISSLINNSNNFNNIISNIANNINTLQNQNSNVFIRNSQMNDVCNNNFMQNMEKIDDSSIANVNDSKDKDGKLGRRKDKEHKRGKRGKDGKIKKKKDKKDKSKSKDKAEKRKEREGKRDKDKIKKLKKEKKKEKRTLMSSTTDDDLKHNVIDFNDTSSSVPKLTLKLGLGNSPQHDSPDSRKTSFKSHNDDAREESFDEGSISRVLADDQRESSPELARISPLVTRPPKQKQSEYMGQNNYMHSHSSIENKYVSSATIASTTYASQGVSFNSPNPQQTYSISSTKSQSLSPSVSNIETMHNANFNATKTNLHSSHNYLPEKSTEQSLPSVNLFQSSSTSMNHSASQSLTGRAAASSVQTSTNVLQTNTFQLSSALNNRPSSYIDAEGNQVWICPACGRVDDGTPMIGCDGCDAWYHWVCVGIQIPPDDKEDWYCRVCIAKKQEAQGSDKKRKRKKKNKAN